MKKLSKKQKLHNIRKSKKKLMQLTKRKQKEKKEKAKKPKYYFRTFLLQNSLSSCACYP